MVAFGQSQRYRRKPFPVLLFILSLNYYICIRQDAVVRAAAWIPFINVTIPGMQHHIETIVRKQDGYAGICPCCGNYNIAFKNLLFNLTEPEFRGLINLLADQRMMGDFPTSHGKEILIPTPLSNFFILLTNQEIGQLLEMMNEVRLVVEARRILGLI